MTDAATTARTSRFRGGARRGLLGVTALAILTVSALVVGPVGASSAVPSPSGAAAPDESASVPPAVPPAGTAPALRANGVPSDGGGSVSAAAAWRIVATPNLGSINNHLKEVSCVNTTRCVAVGYNEDANGFRQSVVESLINGVWKRNSIANRGVSTNSLWNLSCVAGNKCWAVGYYFDVPAGQYLTLIARYSGGFWSLVDSPNRPHADNYLFGVDCTDATHCVAVGRASDPNTGHFRSLVLTLSGSTWALTPSPNRAGVNNLPADVSCGDETHCVAVGYTIDDAGAYNTLILTRNGAGWAVTSSRNVAGGSNLLRDVSCPDATDCVAVGATAPTSGLEQTLVESWSGAAWSVSTSPDKPLFNNHLWGVSCTTTTSCTAVGQIQNDSLSKTLVLNLAAGTWSLVSSPSRGGTYNFLYGLSCPAADSCTAVGDYVNVTSQQYRTLALTNS